MKHVQIKPDIEYDVLSFRFYPKGGTCPAYIHLSVMEEIMRINPIFLIWFAAIIGSSESGDSLYTDYDLTIINTLALINKGAN